MFRKFSDLPPDRVAVAPSILASDFAHLADDVKRVADAGCDLLHLDVMDGHFVPNLTFGPALVSSLRKTSDLCFDTHLMISHPKQYAPVFVKAGADHITFHVESEDDPAETIAAIRSAGATAGISVKPGTKAEALEKYLSLVDMVLVMTVEPGFGGQRFMPEMIGKVAELFEMSRTSNPGLLIEVDGGIDAATAPEIVRAGAGVLVAGTAVFRAPEGADKVIEKLHALSEQLPPR